MNKYQIITDPQILQDFMYYILPKLGQDECFYGCLFARSKYAKNEDGTNQFPHIKSDKSQLKRFTISKIEHLPQKLRQLEVEIGAYTTKDGDPVPQQALASYISVNARSQKKAVWAMMKRLLSLVETEAHGFNIHQEALSAIQQSRSETTYNIFDLDTKDPSEVGLAAQLVNHEACLWLETRGGYHLLIKPQLVSEPYRRTYYREIQALPFVDSDAGNDIMIPIPGTFQGGFTPHFITV